MGGKIINNRLVCQILRQIGQVTKFISSALEFAANRLIVGLYITINCYIVRLFNVDYLFSILLEWQIAKAYRVIHMRGIFTNIVKKTTPPTLQGLQEDFAWIRGKQHLILYRKRIIRGNA